MVWHNMVSVYIAGRCCIPVVRRSIYSCAPGDRVVFNSLHTVISIFGLVLSTGIYTVHTCMIVKWKWWCGGWKLVDGWTWIEWQNLGWNTKGSNCDAINTSCTCSWRCNRLELCISCFHAFWCFLLAIFHMQMFSSRIPILFQNSSIIFRFNNWNGTSRGSRRSRREDRTEIRVIIIADEYTFRSAWMI